MIKGRSSLLAFEHQKEAASASGNHIKEGEREIIAKENQTSKRK
jgi:hypothetical protein